MLIRCPNCGSTAQPKRVAGPHISDNEVWFIEYYKCGCGAYFDALYPREVDHYYCYHVEDVNNTVCPTE